MKSADKKIRNRLKSIWNWFGPNDFVRVIFVAVLAMLLGVIGLCSIVLMLQDDLPDLEKLTSYKPRLTTHILDRNGVLIKELYAQRRLMIPLDSIPQHAVDALLTTEDSRFYDHWGIDVIRIFGAALVDIATFSVQQGASTITQQLARDLFLHKERTFTRKFQEALVAVQIERNYSKREILEMYLTQIYFGHGAYGIQAASQKYFQKSAKDLSIAQSALLAALPKAPEFYTPFRRPQKALERRNLVLRLMYNRDLISEEQFVTAIRDTLFINRGSIDKPLGIAPYFTEQIRQQMHDEGQLHGFDYLTDGVTVHTTLDATLQEFAEAAVDSHIHPFQSAYRMRFINSNREEVTVALYDSTGLNSEGKSVIPLDSLYSDSMRIDSLFPARSVVQIAVVAIDPDNGDILAMIGGRDFVHSKFNRAVQAIRQPGSVFKPVAYTTAIDNGYSPTFELYNQDVVLTMADGTRWVPHNYGYSHGGLTTLREALRRSLNLIAARLVQEVVPPRMVVKYARQLGFSTHIAAVDAVALGASGVYPIEATSAFAVFAAGGIYSTPRYWRSIEDRFGNEIAENPVRQRVALSAETAYIMTDMLSTVINRGTGGSARWKYQFYKTAAGKTGTTNDFTDAWFIGFTPELVCGVWVGLDDPAEQLGRGQSGGIAALPVWARFMKMAYDSTGLEDVEFKIPPGIAQATICADTKLLPTRYCPKRLDEVFRREMVPKETCTKHRGKGN